MPNEYDQPDINKTQKIEKEESEKLTELQAFNYIAYKLNVELEEFEELKITKDDSLENLLDHDEILLFIDNMNCRVWIWEGRNSKTRMKFISAEAAHKIRDQCGAFDYNITTVDDGDEPIEFKIILGLELDVE